MFSGLKGGNLESFYRGFADYLVLLDLGALFAIGFFVRAGGSEFWGLFGTFGHASGGFLWLWSCLCPP